MSLVADGPEIQVSGRRGSSAATASGTPATIWSVRTTHTWWSGTSVSARRPWAGPASSTIVPVVAIAIAQPVSTADASSSSATVSGAGSPSRATSPR